MRTCSKFIEESRMTRYNNIHGFVSYIAKNLRRGYLHGKDFNLEERIMEAELESSDFWDAAMSEAYPVERFEEYLKNEGIDLGSEDGYDYIEKHQEEYQDFLKLLALTMIQEEIDVKDGLIYVERIISSAKHDKFKEFSSEDSNPYEEFLQNNYRGYLGPYWSYKFHGSNMYGNTDEPSFDLIRISGYIEEVDVDWESTIVQNARNDEEYELCIKPGTEVQLKLIEIIDPNNYDYSPRNNGHVIWKKEGYLAKTY